MGASRLCESFVVSPTFVFSLTGATQALPFVHFKDVQKELVTLGQSFAVLTHDLKNTLEGLEGGAYVVDEGITNGDWDLAYKGWHIVKKNITEISRVTQNILYSSKKRTPQLQKVKPNQVARRTVELYQEKAILGAPQSVTGEFLGYVYRWGEQSDTGRTEDNNQVDDAAQKDSIQPAKVTSIAEFSEDQLISIGVSKHLE